MGYFGLSPEDRVVLAALRVGQVLAVTFNLLSLPNIWTIWQTGKVGKFNYWTSTTIMLMASGWMMFGYYIDKVDVILPNLICLPVAFFYLCVLFPLVSDAFWRRTTISCAVLALVWHALLWWLKENRHIETEMALHGIYCNFYTVLCLASPLAFLNKIITDKDASSINPLLAWAGFSKSIAWLIFGLAEANLWIIFPNSIGLPLGALQVALVYTYPQMPKSEDIKSEDIKKEQ